MALCWLYRIGQNPVTKYLGVTQEYLCHKSESLGAIVRAAALRNQNEATGSHSKYNRKHLESFTTEDDHVCVLEHFHPSLCPIKVRPAGK